MKRTLKVYCATYLILLLISTFSTVQGVDPTSTVNAQTITTGPEIPAELSYAMDFVRFLQRAGLVVRSVQRSKLEGMFKGVQKAAFITTDKGVVEVVFFPGSTDAEKIRITSYTVYTTEPVVPYKYKIEGQPTNGDGGSIHAAYPAYFTMYKNWYVETSECELDAIIKRALAPRN